MTTKPNHPVSNLPRVSELRIDEHALDVAQIGAAIMNVYIDALRRFGHHIIEPEDYSELVSITNRVLDRCERKPLPSFDFAPNKAEASH